MSASEEMRRRQTGAQIGVHQAVDGEIDARMQVRQHGRVQVDGQRHDRETERKTLVNFRSFRRLGQDSNVVGNIKMGKWFAADCCTHEATVMK